MNDDAPEENKLVTPPPPREPWLRQHSLTFITITITSTTLILTVFNLFFRNPTSMDFVKKLAVGTNISSIAIANAIPYKVTKTPSGVIRTYCNPEMFSSIFLDDQSNITAFFVISRTTGFKPIFGPTGKKLGTFTFKDARSDAPGQAEVYDFRSIEYAEVFEDSSKQNHWTPAFLYYSRAAAPFSGTVPDTTSFTGSFPSEAQAKMRGEIYPNGFAFGRDFFDDNKHIVHFPDHHDFDETMCQ
ncbi:MAG: ETEC_3214 domain-containing protein [Bdellovibrionota bacterium]